MARALNKDAAKQANQKAQKHSDLTFGDGQSLTRFIWDPLLNSSETSNRIRQKLSSGQGSDSGLLIFGGGLWFLRDKPRPVDDFKDTVGTLTDQFPNPDAETKGKHRALIVPVQTPYYENLDAEHRAFMQEEKVTAMNEYLAQLPTMHDVDVLTSFMEMYQGLPGSAYEPTGRHVAPTISDRQAEVILNLKCNDEQREYTYDGSCCFEYTMDYFQFAILVCGALLLAMIGWVEIQRWTGVGPSGLFANIDQRSPVLWPMLVMWAALSYCYLADRTHLFTKVAKIYSVQDWWIFLAAIAAIGFFSVRKSGAPPKSNREKAQSTDQPFLSRDQTDEWKGWMQALILAYHYDGGSKILSIYRFVRLLVASYLFMSGYGHAAYFYQRNDYSLKRVAAVLIRLNLLSCALPWMMGTDYLFYYFAPLVTYWYLVIYLTFSVKSVWNESLHLLFAKIGLAAAFTSILHMQQWLFEPPFMLVNLVFGAKWDAREWLFRVSLDQYIVYVGMVVAILYVRNSQPPAPPTPPQSSMSTTSHTRPGRFSIHIRRTSYFVASAIALVVYHIASQSRTDKTSSNVLHTYISPLPILAFVHLRNSTRGLRNHHSAAFAWLGRISLETFVLQYHIWLAGDTKDLLSLGVMGSGGMSGGLRMFGANISMGLGRWCDCLLLGTVFIWVSLKVSNATGGITGVATKALFN